MEFECAYKAGDYRAAEILGEALVGSGVKLGQVDLFWLANALYKRGNNAKALDYARLAYSHLNAKDKARCQANVNRCADLRRLLMAIKPSYRTRFAGEDSAIRDAQREAAAEAAEAAREAAAVAYSDSGDGIHSTEDFQVNSNWALEWSYDCTNFAQGTGNFIVDVKGDVEDVLVNQLGSTDSGVEYVHQGGDVYLEINSECSWTVKVVNQ